MPKIRVLIVDDAVVVRRILSDALASDPTIEIAGVAANGHIALQRIPQVNPDLITLDLEMPEMDGLTTLTEIRKLYPNLPVILFSTLTERGAAQTLEGLSRGASDYVTKPANVGSVQLAIQRIRDEMIPKVKSLCGQGQQEVIGRPSSATPRGGSDTAAPARPPTGAPGSTIAGSPASIRSTGAAQSSASARIEPPRVHPRATHFDVLAIGCSTGGPNALAALLPTIPADFPVPVVVVQHMPPLFTRLLAERLNEKCPLSVREAAEGDVLSPGGVWIAPGDHHMELTRSLASEVRVHLQQGPHENSCRPAVDVLFRSVASVYRGQTLAVILTGMGQDGLRGVELIHELGGEIFAQDEASSVVWGMPGFVARAGLASKVLPLDAIGPEIVRRFRRMAA